MNIFAKCGTVFGLLAFVTGIIGIVIGLINPDTLSDFDGLENQLSMAIRYIKIVSFMFC